MTDRRIEQTETEEPLSKELAIPHSLPVVAEVQSDAPAVPRGSVKPYVWAMTGVAFGVIGTLLLVKVQPSPRSIRPTIVAQNTPVVPPTSSVVSPAPGTVMPQGTTTQGGAPLGISPSAPTTAAPQNVGGPSKPVTPAPLNPFGGNAFVLPKLPVPRGGGAPFSGMILPRRLPAVTGFAPPSPNAPTGRMPGPGASDSYLSQLMAKGLPKPPPALKAPISKGAAPTKGTGGKSTLVSVSQLTNDHQGAADDLIAYVKKLGGKAQPVSETGDDGKAEVRGVLATVPEKAVPDLLKHVASAGAVVEKQTWSGTSAERKAKLTEDAEARIASLKKLREALLVTYLEDAQPVKDVDEEIAKASKTIEQVQADKADEKMAVVRIGFVKRS